LIATALLAAFGSGYVIAPASLLPDYTNRDISEEHA